MTTGWKYYTFIDYDYPVYVHLPSIFQFSVPNGHVGISWPIYRELMISEMQNDMNLSARIR
jgi:hypothetical protein